MKLIEDLFEDLEHYSESSKDGKSIIISKEKFVLLRILYLEKEKNLEQELLYHIDNIESKINLHGHVIEND